MGELTFINQYQEDTIDCFEEALGRARKGELKVVILLTLGIDNKLRYSRAGEIDSTAELIELIGSLEHQKAILMGHLLHFTEIAEANSGGDEGH